MTGNICKITMRIGPVDSLYMPGQRYKRTKVRLPLQDLAMGSYEHSPDNKKTNSQYDRVGHFMTMFRTDSFLGAVDSLPPVT